ncbi:MAG: YidH family protein [Acidithiobacillus sp.]|uniref:YidH family protein n=1 Tax=Acidithiobacillus sp. TaxID=1872118 RepID=UPI003D032A09
MLLLKYLPTVREPRLYLGMERTYLSYIKFLFVAFGTGVLSEKLTLLFSVIHLDRLVPFFRDLYLLLTWPSLFLLCLVFFRFVSDLRYVDGGVAVTAKEIQDPRIYLSAERTMLAWFRSGIAMVAFGFVIEKFDFFLDRLSYLLHARVDMAHTFAGMDVVFVVLGMINLLLGGVGFGLTVQQVDRGAYTPHKVLYLIYGSSLFAAIVVLSFLLLQVGA